MLTTKKIAALIAALALAGATAPIASADPPKQKCNSGNGNGSEVAGKVGCDRFLRVDDLRMDRVIGRRHLDFESADHSWARRRCDLPRDQRDAE